MELVLVDNDNVSGGDRSDSNSNSTANDSESNMVAGSKVSVSIDSGLSNSDESINDKDDDESNDE